MRRPDGFIKRGKKELLGKIDANPGKSAYARKIRDFRGTEEEHYRQVAAKKHLKRKEVSTVTP